MEKIDLHIHTNYSDGSYNLEQLFHILKEKQISKIAIADHDEIYHLRNYRELEEKYGLEIIPAIELGSDVKKMHILGYGITDIDRMDNFLTELKLKNRSVCLELIEILRKNGYDISFDTVMENMNLESSQRNSRVPILNKREIVKVLMKKGYSNSVKETYNKIIGRNTEFYIPIMKLTAKQIIDLIHDCGGIAVLAHPGSLRLGMDELSYQLLELMKLGLDGIEVLNLSADPEKRQKYEEIADTLGLIKTVGSDFHTSKNEIGVLEYEKIWYDITNKINERQKILKKEK